MKLGFDLDFSNQSSNVRRIIITDLITGFTDAMAVNKVALSTNPAMFDFFYFMYY